MRCCCSPKCSKWTTIIVSVIILVLGILLATLWETVFSNIVNKQLSVSNKDTQGFKNWQETPIPMYLEIHLFNWTNADRVQKYPRIKPNFVEMGPYTFHEHHIKENITFNENDTITYLNKRIWHFRPEMSKGSLDDMVTFLNPIVMVLTNQIKDEHYLVKRAVNFFLEDKGESLATTKTVREVLFDGYNDVLIDIALKLKIAGLNLPFKSFGWFVDRNGSSTFDGVYNMYDGGKDISKLGLITNWNYQHSTSYYPGECGIISGTSGELWYPPKNRKKIAIFSPDVCSDVALHWNGSDTMYGIDGHLYEGQADVFDNGTFDKSTECFASGMPYGVRDVSLCKFGAPAYMSFPHFNLADPIYRRSVDGMNPDPAIHSTKISLEPSTGLPLRVHAAFQINLLMRNIKGIDMLANIKDTMMPCFWFVQKAELSEDLAGLAKSILMGKRAGAYVGYGLLGLGTLVLGIFAAFHVRKSCQSNEEEQLLDPQES